MQGLQLAFTGLCLSSMILGQTEAIFCWQCGSEDTNYLCTDSQEASDAVMVLCHEPATRCVARTTNIQTLQMACYGLRCPPGTPKDSEQGCLGTLVEGNKTFALSDMEPTSERENEVNLNSGCFHYEEGRDCFCDGRGCNKDCPYTCSVNSSPRGPAGVSLTTLFTAALLYLSYIL